MEQAGDNLSPVKVGRFPEGEGCVYIDLDTPYHGLERIYFKVRFLIGGRVDVRPHRVTWRLWEVKEIESQLGETTAESDIPDKLKTLLEDEAAIVRKASVQALTKAKAKGIALKYIVAALKDKDPSVRIQAAAAVAEIGDRAGIGRLQEALNTETDESAKAAIINAVKQLQSSEHADS